MPIARELEVVPDVYMMNIVSSASIHSGSKKVGCFFISYNIQSVTYIYVRNIVHTVLCLMV